MIPLDLRVMDDRAMKIIARFNGMAVQ